jgi:hypothetical protein
MEKREKWIRGKKYIAMVADYRKRLCIRKNESIPSPAKKESSHGK